jgi:hypothetical protein
LRLPRAPSPAISRNVEVLDECGGGRLGVLDAVELVISTRDTRAAGDRWQRLFDPLEPAQPLTWRLPIGPPVTLVGRGRRARRPSSPRRAIGGSCPPGLARACGGNARSIPTAVRCRLAVACGVPRPDQPLSAAPTTMQSPAVVLRPDPRDHWPVSWAARASDAWHETGLHGRCDECNERSGRSMFGGQPL